MMQQQVTTTETVDIRAGEGEVVGQAIIQSSTGDINSVLLGFNLGVLGQAAVRLTPSDAHRIGVLLCNAACDAGEDPF
jgi:hypothetical protein